MTGQLFIVRHASYDTNERGSDCINSEGKEEMASLGRVLREITPGPFTALTSTSQRALQSLEALSHFIKIGETAQSPLLFGGYCAPADGYQADRFPDVLELIRRHRNGQPLIVITHTHPAADLMTNAIKDGYVELPGTRILAADKGECYYLDEARKFLSLLPRDFNLLPRPLSS